MERPSARVVIVLTHGIRSNRRSLIDRARFLANAGFAVLLFDLRAHGESPGAALSFGHGEAKSVAAVLRYVRDRWRDRKVGLIGDSLGGAAAILAARTERADAYVLEGVYSSLREATENRFVIRMGEAGRLVARAMLWQVPLRLGFHVEELSLTSRISGLNAPLLMMAGTNDRKTTPANTRDLFEVASEPKQLWMIQGARHQDLHRYAPRAYEQKVLAFFKRALRR